MKKISIILFTVLLALLVFVSCDQSIGDLIGFNVSFNANAGTGTMDTVFVKGSVYEAPANGFARDGYTFTGWNTMADGSGDSYNVGDEINGYAALSINLFAQWQANTYDINIAQVSNGSVASLYDKYTVKEETVSIPLSVLPDTGYRLSGYEVQNASIDGDYLVISAGTFGDITIIPSFAANDYSVRFNANSGSGSMDDQDFTFDKAQTLSAVGFTKTGYTFAGWNTSEGGSGEAFDDKESVVNLTTTYGAVVELYAQWTVNTYTVDFRSNDGAEQVVYEDFTYDIAQNLTVNTFKRTGYTFTGWNTEADGSGTAYADGALVINLLSENEGKMPLFAQWDAHTYEVRFFKTADDSAGQMNAQAFTYDEELKALSVNAFTRKGYTFTGWNTAADGSGVAFENQKPVRNLTSVDNGVFSLYAQWKLDVYDVTAAEAEHGSVTAESTAYSISDSIQTIALNITPDTGYELSSLTATAPATVSGSTLTIPAGTAKDITVTATFAPCVYNVSFNVAGGEINAGEITTYTYGTGAELPTDVTKDGNTFEGWWDNPNYTGAKVTEISTTDVGDRTFYAMWNATGYEITFSTVEHGSASALYNEYTINEGVISIQLSANPAKGYELEKYTVDEAAESAGVTVDGDTLIIPAGAALDITVTPHFTLVVYTITINKSDMGSATSTASGYEISDAAKEVTLTATPKDTSLYDLFDWDVVAPAGVTVKTVSVTKATITIPAGTVGDISITPVFLPKFKVTLHKNGGTVDEGYDVTSYFVAVGAKLPTSDHFKNEGNVFDGWYANSSLTGDKVTAIGRTDLGEKEYWAKWIYSISYNANTATSGSAPASQTGLLVGQSVTLRGNTGSLAKTGYTFNGWNTKADGTGTHYNSSAEVSGGLGGNTTLYAEWTYTITYAANGATSGTVPPAQTPHAGNDVTLATNTGNLARTGYTFNGWNTAANGSGTHYDAGAKVEGGLSNTTLYAEWTYTIAYNANDATSGTAPESQTGRYAGVNVTLKGNTGSLARTGYTFNGWNTKADGSGTHYNAGATVTGGLSEITLYAEWTYTIAYYKNGASSGSAPASQTNLHAGNNVTLKGNTGDLAKTGYSFNGWNTKADGTGTHYNAGATVTGGLSEITLNAEWKANKYTVKFFTSAEATTPYAQIQETYNAYYELPAENPTKDGYTFGGWWTSPTAGDQKTASTKVTTAADQNLYAHWTANTYKVKFDKNDEAATGTMSDQTFTYDVAQKLTANGFSKIGYTFTGWNTKADGTGTGYADGKSVSNLAKSGEVTLYAQWELTVYTITFTDKTGGHTITPSSVQFTYSATEDKVIEISFEGTIEHTQVNAPLTVKYDISELDVKKITILKGSYGGDVSVSIWFE